MAWNGSNGRIEKKNDLARRCSKHSDGCLLIRLNCPVFSIHEEKHVENKPMFKTALVFNMVTFE